jgi:hypothetical protein
VSVFFVEQACTGDLDERVAEEFEPLEVEEVVGGRLGQSAEEERRRRSETFTR